MKTRIYPIGILLCTAFLFCSCVSVISNSQNPAPPEPKMTPKVVTIYDRPDQPNITIRDEKGKLMHAGRTPASIRFDKQSRYLKGKNYAIIISKEGYKERTAKVKNSTNGWTLSGEVFSDGLKGCLIVDPLTGSMWTLDKSFKVVLPDSSTELNDFSELTVVGLDHIPEDVKKNMIKIN